MKLVCSIRLSIWTLLHLHDSHRHASVAESLTDTEDNATILHTLKIANCGYGNQKQRSKLEKYKKDTILGKQVAAFKFIKKDGPFSNATTPQEMDVIFDPHHWGSRIIVIFTTPIRDAETNSVANFSVGDFLIGFV
ncbi:hypothetical protein PS6_000292 [Mucor atramentarius]